MSANAGQSLTPYPWHERKKFNDSRRMISPVVRVTRVLMYIATVLSPPSIVFWLWARFGYRRNNDSWSKRGLATLAIGGLSIAVFSPEPMEIVSAWDSLLRSFGPDSLLDVRECLIDVVLVALPYSIVLQGLHSLSRSFQIERTTSAFLKPQRATLGMRAKRRLNIRRLRRGESSRRGGGYARFGVIEDDRIPWRSSRYGMVVEKKIERMGHGVFIGSNGTGKTKAAETFSHYVLGDDGAVIYIDFKASLSTMRGLSAVARANGKPCHILDIGFGTTDTSWYDLFAWDGSPGDKSNVLVECFQFADGEGGAAYYRGVAEAWMPMQIEAAELLGLREGEGMFDFLLETAVPTRFRNRITPLRDSKDPHVRGKFELWTQEASNVKSTDLQGLRNELTKIINAAGNRLKPNAQNPNPVSMKEVMDDGGMVYIGIASGINDVVVKVLGSFLFKELSILVAARCRVPDTGSLRDVFVIPDEASEMEERSVMMNPLYTMAREARIFLWPSFQSFAVWDDSTQKEIRANTINFLAFSVPDRETAAAIGETIPDIWALQQMSEEQTRQQAFQEQTVGISGDARLSIVTDSFLRPHIELSQVSKYHSYIWFKDAPTVPRERWWGRRRVKKDQIKGDAPLVKLIPYDLVMPENDAVEDEVRSDTPETVQSTVLPDDGQALGVPESQAPPASSGGATDYYSASADVDAGWGADHAPALDAERVAQEEEVPPEDASSDVGREPPAPPRWSTSTVAHSDAAHGPRRSGGEPHVSEASSKLAVASGSGMIPPPAEADGFTDDGADDAPHVAAGHAPVGEGGPVASQGSDMFDPWADDDDSADSDGTNLRGQGSARKSADEDSWFV